MSFSALFAGFSCSLIPAVSPQAAQISAPSFDVPAPPFAVSSDPRRPPPIIQAKAGAIPPVIPLKTPPSIVPKKKVSEDFSLIFKHFSYVDEIYRFDNG